MYMKLDGMITGKTTWLLIDGMITVITTWLLQRRHDYCKDGMITET